MKTHIEVSVIIPMFNVENLIAETINSLKKNRCNIEFLLIDDGSTDNTYKNAVLAAQDDSRFKFIQKTNSGVSETRNVGLAQAQGEYILFVDSDDLMADYAIDKLYFAAIEQNADYVYGGIKKFNQTKTWTIKPHDDANLFSYGIKHIELNPELFLSMGPVAKLIHKSLMSNNEFPSNIHYSEDQAVIFDILINAKKILCIGEYIYFYRERNITVNDRSIMQQRDTKAFSYLNDIFSVMDINKDAIHQRGYTDNIRNNILGSYYARAFRFDVYPLFIKTLQFQPQYSSQAFDLLINFIKKTDEIIFNKNPEIRYFLMRDLINRVYLIKPFSFKQYRLMLQLLIKKLSKKTQEACSSPRYWGNHWFDNYHLANKNPIAAFALFLQLRIKKRCFGWLNQNSTNIIKTYIFPVMAICLPIQKHKIIFATSAKGKVSKNFEYMLNALKKDGNRYIIKKYLGTTNIFRRKLLRYYHLATADTIFLESYYAPLYGLKPNRKTKVVQLWHACGAFKKFGFSALEQMDSNTEEFERNAHSFYTHIITSSAHTGELYAQAFNAPSEKIYPLGVPRTDYFFNQQKLDNSKRNILNRYPELKKTTNILYSPTFRGSPSERKRFQLPFDFNICDSLPSNYRLIIKLHPIVDIKNIRIPKQYQNRILLLDSKEDINEWMIFCNLLITDYSSLIFEYALLDKPIIFYAYDKESYFDERGFYEPYDNYTYGPVVSNQVALVTNIVNLLSNKILEKSVDTTDFKYKFMDSCKGYTCKLIIENIIKKQC